MALTDYTPPGPSQTWENAPSTNTPISATNLNAISDWIDQFDFSSTTALYILRVNAANDGVEVAELVTDKALDDLTDVTATSPATGDLVQYTGAGYELVDVNTITAASAEISDTALYNSVALQFGVI